MEDLAGEREIKMSARRLNLNTLPLTKHKQHHKAHETFHFRTTGIKVMGKEDDVQECKECHRVLPLTAFTTKSKRADGAAYLHFACRECKSMLYSEQIKARKNAPPKPDNCDNCHKNKKLQIDHIHGTTKVRGWVCRNCNTGIGSLGDTLEGLLQAAVYLEKDKSKIIETLNDLE